MYFHWDLILVLEQKLKTEENDLPQWIMVSLPSLKLCKCNLLSRHLSRRCQSALMTARTQRIRGTSLATTTHPITPCWGRRACSGLGVWVRKVCGGRGRAGIRTKKTPSALPSSASTSTGALRGKSCQNWSATAWGTWASPHLDMVMIDTRKPTARYLIVFNLTAVCVPVDDLTNLTASDVMNRVNLGYLQGIQLMILQIQFDHGIAFCAWLWWCLCFRWTERSPKYSLLCPY